MTGRNAGGSAGWSAGRCAGRSAGISVQSTHTRTCRRRSRAATLVGATETHDVLASISAVVVKQRKQSRILSARAAAREGGHGDRERDFPESASRDRMCVDANLFAEMTKQVLARLWASEPGEMLERSRLDDFAITLAVQHCKNVGRLRLRRPVFSFDSSARGSGLSRTCRGGRKEGWGGTRLRAERGAQDGGRFG
jgi:hypothetical protein